MFSTFLSSSLSSLLGGLAYLDPGSGSFILQILLATLLGGLFVVKTYWRKITTFFRERFSSKQREDKE